jgi:hypothetical protein
MSSITTLKISVCHSSRKLLDLVSQGLTSTLATVVPDAASPEAIRLSTRISEAEKACSLLSNLIESSQTATLRTHAIAHEVDDIANILQIFRSQFMNEDQLDNLVWVSKIEGVEESLDRCIIDFEGIQARIQRAPEVHEDNGGPESETGVLSDNDVAGLREDLRSYRVKFSLAIAMVNLCSPKCHDKTSSC